MPTKIALPLVSGTAHLRISHKIGRGLVALCAGSVGLASFASPVAAQDECGLAADGSVTCPTNQSYPNGITYKNLSDIRVNAPSGVVVNTTTDGTYGVTINSAGASTLAGSAVVATNGANSYGISVNAGGAASVSVASITTNGVASVGMYADGVGTVTENATSITTNGASSPGLYAFGGGAVLVNTGTVSTTGAGAGGIYALSGPSSVTVNAGSTTGFTAYGIYAVSGTGPVSVTAGTTSLVPTPGFFYSPGDGHAIYASGGGLVNVTSGSASSIVSSAIAAISTAGAANVSLIGGPVSSVDADGIDVTGTTSASLTTAVGSSVMGVNGVTISSGIGTTVNNGGTLGGTIYALSTTGAPAMVNNTGTINGAIDFGTYAVSPGALPGSRSTLDAAAGVGGDVVNNSGTFNAAGTSLFVAGDVFNNSGLLALAASGGAPATATFSGLGTFNNTRTIDLRNGAVGDTLNLDGNYFGSGSATLGLDVAPGAKLASDRLSIGGTATGSTTVFIALPVGGLPSFSNGATIVQVGTTSPATAFALSPTTQNFGLVRYDVVYDPANLTYNLVGAPSDAGLNMLGYQTAERNLWYKSADAVSAQLQAKRDQLWNLGGTPPSGRFWVSMAGSYDHASGYHDFGTLGQDHLTDTSYQQDYFGGQLGLDLSGGLLSRGGFSVGVTGGYINSKVKLGNSLDNIAFDAANGGAYVSFTTGHIFATALGKYDYYWATPESQTAGFDLHLHGHSYGARGELGIRLGSNSFFVEPLAQISYLRTSLDPFAVQGTSVNFDDRDALRGKAGGRIGGNTSISADTKLAFYAGASYVHDFQGQSEVIFANLGGTDTVSGLKARDAGEGLVGVNIASIHGISGFMEATYKRSFGSGDNGLLTENGAGGRAGIRIGF